MATRSPSFHSSKTRSLGIASFFVLVGAMMFPVPGCSEDPVPQGGCREGDIQNAAPADCVQLVCRSGKFVEEAAAETPDDMNPCTDDTCVDKTAMHAPNTGACTVGDSTGTCMAGACAVTCAMDSDCNDNSVCTNDTCDGTTCTFTDDPANYDDNNECTTDTCVDGKAVSTPAAAGAPCGSAGTCDGNGVCTGCKADSDCPNDELCRDHYCDTGTATCKSTPLPDGDLGADDIVGDCQYPSCSGGAVVYNVLEMDVKDDGIECTVDTCSNGMPANDPAAAETTCSTGVCDGATSCVQCVVATNCGAAGDFTCSTNMCFDCNDGAMNGNETDADCGGECGAKCGDGKMCMVNDDCGSGACDANNTCVSCGDGTLNGTETDIDCGGATCSKCNTGQVCVAGTDCVQGVCNAMNKCAAASCSDTIKNGAETDVDCGGGTCPKCMAGKTCKVNSDCVGGTQCMNGVCG